jgi:transcriptional regulator with XRE-family HTH domain
MKYDAYAIGQRAYNIRNNRNITQKEISEALDIGQSSYSRFETGQGDLPFEKVIMLCDYLNISLSWLSGEHITNQRLTPDELIELEQYRGYLINKRNKNKP